MTSLLDKLQAAHVFDPTPPEVELGDLHVPFDDLTDTETCEARLLAALRRGERAALIGASGVGKSSVTEYVLGPLVEHIAPIRLRVALDPNIASEPVAFARHLVRTVARYVEQADPAHQSQAREHVRAVTGKPPHRPLRISLGGGYGWLHADLALDIGAVTDAEPHGDDVIEQPDRSSISSATAACNRSWSSMTPTTGSPGRAGMICTRFDPASSARSSGSSPSSSARPLSSPFTSPTSTTPTTNARTASLE